MIILLFLTTLSHDYVLILFGENWCLSLLGVEELFKLNYQSWVLFEVPYSDDGSSFARHSEERLPRL